MQTKVICVILLCAASAAANPNKIGEQQQQQQQQQKKQQLDWWENGVFYQIYPRSFKDSDGDGVGDIRGIIEKLDYLQELGINGAWLSPIFKSPMVDFGYDISSFYDIDPIFGTMEDLEELFVEAKKRGIKIILDFVPNHSSDEHDWFKKSVDGIEPYKDYYIWRDGKNDNKDPPNNWVSAFYGPAWTYNEKRKQWYYHCFASQQPDLNYRSEHLVDEMFKILEFWLKKGAGGFRVDAVPHLYEDEEFRDEPLSGTTKDNQSYSYTLHYYTNDLPEMYEMIYKFRDAMDEWQKEHGGDTPIIMTEAYTNATEFPKYYQSADGKRIGAHMPFNFVLITDLWQSSSANDFKRVIDDHIASIPADVRYNWVIGNHDQPRVGSRFGEQKIDGLLALVMTLPGIAVTYNGDEIGMVDNRDGISYNETVDPAACNLPPDSNWRKHSRDPERTPHQWDSSKYAGFMSADAPDNIKPWLPVHPNYKEVNVALQKEFKRSTLKFYKQLIELRKMDTFARGTFNSTVLNENVLAYVRALNGNDTYVVLINFGAREETIQIQPLTEGIDEHLPEELEISAAGADSCYWQGNTVNSNNVILRKYDAIILKVPYNDGASVIASITLTIGLAVFKLIAPYIF